LLLWKLDPQDTKQEQNARTPPTQKTMTPISKKAKTTTQDLPIAIDPLDLAQAQNAQAVHDTVTDPQPATEEQLSQMSTDGNTGDGGGDGDDTNRSTGWQLSDKTRKHPNNKNVLKVALKPVFKLQLGKNGFNAMTSAYGLSSEYGTLTLTGLSPTIVSDLQDVEDDCRTTYQNNLERFEHGRTSPRTFHPILNPNDGETCITIKVRTTGEFPTILVNKNNKPVPITDLNRGCKVIAVVKFCEIWTDDNKYGVALYTEELKVKKGVREEVEFEAGWQEGW